MNIYTTVIKAYYDDNEMVRELVKRWITGKGLVMRPIEFIRLMERFVRLDLIRVWIARFVLICFLSGIATACMSMAGTSFILGGAIVSGLSVIGAITRRIENVIPTTVHGLVTGIAFVAKGTVFEKCRKEKEEIDFTKCLLAKLQDSSALELVIFSKKISLQIQSNPTPETIEDLTKPFKTALQHQVILFQVNPDSTAYSIRLSEKTNSSTEIERAQVEA